MIMGFLNRKPSTVWDPKPQLVGRCARCADHVTHGVITREMAHCALSKQTSLGVELGVQR